MARSDRTARIIDGISKVAITTGTLSIAIIAPGLLRVLDKPTAKYLRTMDRRARERELRRITAYMLRQGLISEDYQHGIYLTKRGQQRLRRRELETLSIPKPKKWDGEWHIIMFDIPNSHKFVRSTFVAQLRKLGLQPLQQSVWIYPYPYRDEITRLALEHKITRYITYIKTSHIDQSEHLRTRFSDIL